jgi:hypothetical protein
MGRRGKGRSTLAMGGDLQLYLMLIRLTLLANILLLQGPYDIENSLRRRDDREWSATAPRQLFA